MVQKQKIKLSEELISMLVNTPETGMGFHSVNVYLKNGNILKNQIVSNSSILLIEYNTTLSIEDINRIEVLKK